NCGVSKHTVQLSPIQHARPSVTQLRELKCAPPDIIKRSAMLFAIGPGAPCQGRNGAEKLNRLQRVCFGLRLEPFPTASPAPDRNTIGMACNYSKSEASTPGRLGEETPK